jgi:hypothetical protein
VPSIATLTLRALSETGCGRPPGYERALRRACALRPPPFGMAWYGETYRECAMRPRWVAESLLLNAEQEAEGAATIWELAGMTEDEDAGRQVRRHAQDECRHARLYLVILKTIFPSALSPEVERDLWARLPRYTNGHGPATTTPLSRREFTDAIIQMNIGEIRTRINQLLAMPVLMAYCAPERRDRLCGMLDSLLRDETRHVAYTASLIERAIAAGEREFVSRTMVRRLEDIGTLTMAEVTGRAASRR